MISRTKATPTEVGGFNSARLRKHGGTSQAEIHILVDYLLEQTALNGHIEAPTEAGSILAAEPRRAVRL
jgi:hypothetical protein